MSPLTHLLASWTIGAQGTNNPRDCRLVTLAGILPDADGLGLVIDFANEALGNQPTQFYAHYHHYFLHGWVAALAIAMVFTWLARQRWRVLVLCLAVFHLHLVCDFVGSRGPSTVDLWPIFYFGPLDHTPMWIWKGQWRLDGWQNRVITLALFGWSLWLTVQKGYSPLGVFTRRADEVFVRTLKRWQADLQQLFRRKAVQPEK